MRRDSRPRRQQWTSGSNSAPPRSRNAVFAATSVALLMGSIDTTIVATALPSLTANLHTSVGWSAWTISAYQLGSVTATPLAGQLSDKLGRKRMFFVFISIFTAASMLCGLANDIDVLIILRFIQALGGGGLVPSATGIVADQFGRDRDRPIGLMTSIFPLGALIGPAIGGVIVTYFSWRLIFLINVPVGLILMGLLARFVPADPPRGKSAIRVDAIGAVFMTLTILAFMLGLSAFGQTNFASVEGWTLLLVASLFGVVFGLRQRHSVNPIFPAALLKQRAFARVNGLNILYGAGTFGIFSLVPLFAQTSFGLRPLQAGALLAIRAGTMAVVAAATSIVVLKRFGYRAPMIAGFILSAAGLVMLSVSPPGMSPFAWLCLSSVVCGFGVGIAGPPSNNANIQLMPAQVGAIVGLRAMFRQTGGIVSISVAAAIMSSSPSGARLLPVIFIALAALTLAATPAIVGVPENPARSGHGSPPPLSVDV